MDTMHNSASAREAKTIRAQYEAHAVTKLEQLKALDKQVKKPAKVTSLIIGTISVLVLGAGMSMIMEWTSLMLPGVILGVVGMAGCLITTPVYKSILQKQQNKFAPQILQLSDEVLAESEAA